MPGELRRLQTRIRKGRVTDAARRLEQRSLDQAWMIQESDEEGPEGLWQIVGQQLVYLDPTMLERAQNASQIAVEAPESPSRARKVVVRLNADPEIPCPRSRMEPKKHSAQMAWDGALGLSCTGCGYTIMLQEASDGH